LLISSPLQADIADKPEAGTDSIVIQAGETFKARIDSHYDPNFTVGIGSNPHGCVRVIAVNSFIYPQLALRANAAQYHHILTSLGLITLIDAYGEKTIIL
jgi:hypothetical protein